MAVQQLFGCVYGDVEERIQRHYDVYQQFMVYIGQYGAGGSGVDDDSLCGGEISFSGQAADIRYIDFCDDDTDCRRNAFAIQNLLGAEHNRFPVYGDYLCGGCRV